MIPFVDISAMHSEVRGGLDAAWQDVTGSGRFIGGPFVDRFEAEWADYCQTRFCVGLNSGTAALELTLSALGIGPGDEVIVPTNTFIATAAAIAAVGADPVFADVDAGTLLITAEGIRSAVTSKTAAVIVVHLFGQPANMDEINSVASHARICVIEDAAQAHGATWREKKVGSVSTAGCFSFYPGKNLGAFGDAGAVVTDDMMLAERIRALSNHGRQHDDPYRHDLLGGSERLDALQAALLSAKLPRLDDWNEERRRVAGRYVAALAELPIEFVPVDWRARSSHHLFVIQTTHRDELRHALSAEHIATGIHYPIPCHKQLPFLSTARFGLPTAERAARRMLSLPMYPHLTNEQIDVVADVIRSALEVFALKTPDTVE